MRISRCAIGRRPLKPVDSVIFQQVILHALLLAGGGQAGGIIKIELVSLKQKEKALPEERAFYIRSGEISL
jgi:hypothetical protein